MTDDTKGMTRQKLYDRIRQSSKDEVILEEMTRLGFWPAEQDKPSPAAAALKRRGELQRELRELLAKQQRLNDPERAIKDMHKQRMAQAMARRKESKQRREAERHEKALAWYEKQKTQILYLGEGTSRGLNQTQDNITRLEKYALPRFADGGALAAAMGITLQELRFLAYTRKTATLSHYRHFEIAKKTGGQRKISTPMPRLKRSQYWILDAILNKVALHPAAHGFVAGRSIVSNARPHTQAAVVVNMDLEDFFPTITYRRIKGLFHSLGYSEHIATLLGLLCSESPTREVELDGQAYFVAQGERRLPQGAPTSPAISNLICRKLDARIAGTAAKLGFTYTRYADDLSFSANRDNASKLGKLFWRIGQIIQDEGFIIRADKTRIMRANNHQEVTGIVVNQRCSIDRKTLKRFRALLHQIEKDGPQGKRWGGGANVLSAINGYAHYVAMVDPAKGSRFVAQVRQLKERYGQGQAQPQSNKQLLNNVAFRAAAAAGLPPRNPWWQAQAGAAPLPPAHEAPAQMPNTEDVLGETPLQRSGTGTSFAVLFKLLFWVVVMLLLALVISRF